MTVSTPAQKARALYEARRDRTPIAPFTDAEPALTMADGYAIQQELVLRLLADGEQVMGYKVGLTSAAMQELLGVDSPDFGPVLSSTALSSGDTLDLERFIAPRIEAEITFVLGERLQGPGVTLAEARRALAGAVASLEVVDSRIAGWRIRLADTVADLASGGALVLSERVVAAGEQDWSAAAMVLRRNGEVIATGTGAAALGDPVAVVAWLADVLGSQGVALQAGQVVMTGALHAAVEMSPADEYVAEFDHLGSVALSITGDRPSAARENAPDGHGSR